MRKVDRVKAVLTKRVVDRPPISLWKPYPEFDRDPIFLAQAHVEFQEKFDLDFIKLTPFDLYCVEDWGVKVKYFHSQTEVPIVEQYVIRKFEDWRGIKVLDPTKGTFGKQVLLARSVKSLAKDDVPFVQTVYSPLTVARKLAGDRLIQDLREYPAIIHKVLENITETTIEFVKANLAEGAAGIFFATACANFDFLKVEEYREFGRQYDLKVLEAAKAAWFNTLHIHGRNIMFDELLDYPVHALNWHDCHEYPPVRRARAMTDLCIIGGLDEEGPIANGTPIEVIEEVTDFLQETNLQGVIVGPGCSTTPAVLPNNITAARLVVERYADKENWKYLSLDSSGL
ncbi:MAG: hypothetical protein LLG02_14525 [Pelosinus sp.]|nr:hypothetical protein [Pelosinus sp.]